LLHHALKRVLNDNADLDLSEAEDREALTDELVEALAATLFGPRALLGQPGEPPRKVHDLFKRAKKWTTEQEIPVASVTLEDEAIELGDGAYLAWEELDSGEARPVLGYDMPETGRFYFHRFHPDTRVFVTDGGVVVIAHTDLLLTPFGIDEEAPGGADNEDDPHFHPEDADVSDDVILVGLDIPERLFDNPEVTLPEKPVSKAVEAEIIEALDLGREVQGVMILTEDVPESVTGGSDDDSLITGDFIIYTEGAIGAFRLVGRPSAADEDPGMAAEFSEG